MLLYVDRVNFTSVTKIKERNIVTAKGVIMRTYLMMFVVVGLLIGCSGPQYEIIPNVERVFWHENNSYSL